MFQFLFLEIESLLFFEDEKFRKMFGLKIKTID